MKLLYILLIALLFFIPKERFAIPRPYLSLLGASVLVFGVAAVWFAGYQQITSTTVLKGVGLSGQIQFFFKHPSRAILALSKEFLLSPHRLVSLFYFGFLDLPMRETLIPIFVFYLTVVASNLGREKTI
ncbi:DUF2142 domain-containing protein, partial [Streptococcus suis]|uniref:DUF2142 domain-containing protein n=1 Tax=Streptococcus suis TaxID=1307 RepID=UPI001EDF9E05